jgi:hypothetical protein
VASLLFGYFGSGKRGQGGMGNQPVYIESLGLVAFVVGGYMRRTPGFRHWRGRIKRDGLGRLLYLFWSHQVARER